MKLRKPPWYGWVEDRLNSVEGLTNTVLILIAVIAILLVIKGDSVQKTAFAVYLVSP